jgi:hypothetical protein
MQMQMANAATHLLSAQHLKMDGIEDKREMIGRLRDPFCLFFKSSLQDETTEVKA